jgi:N-acetylglucosamine-6-phosphate deacetylase
VRLEFPGLFDLQVNGFGGVDFNAADLPADRLAEALERQRATGVTRCLPTLITSSLDRFARNARIIARSTDPAVAGLHMEGPYISPEDGPRGAHPREYVIDASVADFERRQEAADGRIVLVTFAPEAPGAPALVEHLIRTGVKVAIGHTAATPRQVEKAIAAGATLATHLGNGAAQILPRHPNFIWTLLSADAVTASFIVDGHHLPPATAKAMMRAKTAERCILVTDATSAAGCGPGRYSIGDVVCELGEDGRVALPGSPYLAGSSLTLDRAIANTVKFTGMPIDAVLPMASRIPARFLDATPAGTVIANWDPERTALEVVSVRTEAARN